MVEIKIIKRRVLREGETRNVDVEREVNPGHLSIIPLCGHFAPITQPAQLMDSER